MDKGIHTDIPHREYHSLRAISNGYLKSLSSVPAAAKVKGGETPAMIFGRAQHVYTLEGEEAFFKEVAVAPQCDKRTKAGKEAWAKFSEENSGKDVVTEEEFETIKSINTAVYSHPLAAKMLEEGISEVTAIWKDKETGLLCKCRPDRIPTGDRGVILDLKTCADASEFGFQRAVTTFRYYQQAAWYIDGVNAAGGKSVDAMAFIAVEKTPPYRTEVYILADDFVDFGRSEYRRLMDIEKKCRRDKAWPHYLNPGATDIFKPSWMV